MNINESKEVEGDDEISLLDLLYNLYKYKTVIYLCLIVGVIFNVF